MADAGVSTVIGAIPARYESSRFPGKPLASIAGKPMIEHVYQRAVMAGLDSLVVLTDDERIREAVEAFGGSVEMTPVDCSSGTDRIAWAAREWDFDAVINIQGDEPLIDPAVIKQIAEVLRSGEAPMVTMAAPATGDDAEDPNVVKVVCDQWDRALYFSRSPIPFPRNPAVVPLKHIGIYGYQRMTLLELSTLAPTALELAEGLEQLRALQHRIPITVLRGAAGAPGVDTPEDLQRVENYLDANPSASVSGALESQEE